jgi:hypothetical protein
MEQTIDPRAEYARAVAGSSTAQSAASWPAIIAGAVVAVSVSLVLFALGSGLGFASVSPWPGHGVSATTFTVSMAIWLIVTQWVSAGVGGYITGRLRTRWVGTHTHEVFFRDTAHGLVTWSLATVLVAATMATTLFSAIGGGVHTLASAGASSAGAAASASAGGQGLMAGPHAMPGVPGSEAYGVDKLFRTSSPGNMGAGNMGAINGAGGAQGPAPGWQGPMAGGRGSGEGDPRTEAAHIAANAWATGAVPDEDRSYLAQLVAARTGSSPADAQKRVDDFISDVLNAQTKAKAAADAARKAAAQAAIYTALSLLVGAFIACVAAALGGRLRDEHL